MICPEFTAFFLLIHNVATYLKYICCLDTESLPMADVFLRLFSQHM